MPKGAKIRTLGQSERTERFAIKRGAHQQRRSGRFGRQVVVQRVGQPGLQPGDVSHGVGGRSIDVDVVEEQDELRAAQRLQLVRLLEEALEISVVVVRPAEIEARRDAVPELELLGVAALDEPLQGSDFVACIQLSPQLAMLLVVLWRVKIRVHPKIRHHLVDQM